MKSIFPTIIIFSVIALFSMLHCESVSAIYAYAGALIGLSSEAVSVNDVVISNYGHMAAYCLLLVVLCGWQDVGMLKSTIVVLVIAGGFELIQRWLPSRQADIGDLVYDAIGILIGHALLFSKRKIASIWGRTKLPS